MTVTRPPVEPAALAAPRPSAPRRPREQPLFLAALGVIALHVVDDSFVQPQPGTSAGDHLVSGLVPLGALALAAAAFVLPEAGHVGAQDARPREYERRITRFFDQTLRKEQP